MDLPTPGTNTAVTTNVKRDFLSKLKKAGKKVITMDNLEGVRSIVG